MRRAIRKPCNMILNNSIARITEINNFLNLFPGLDITKKVTPEELNEILLHVVPNVWDKQDYLQGWDFWMKTFRETCAMFKRMEISEQVYKGQTPLKKLIPYANRDSRVRKRKGGESALPTNHNKGRTSKRKTKIQSLQVRRRSVQIKHACYMAP